MPNFIDSIDASGGELYAKDAYGNVGFVAAPLTGRKSLLIAGCSIALGSGGEYYYVASGSSTTLLGNHLPGKTQVQLAAGGVAAKGITIGDTIGISLGIGQLHTSKVTEIATDLVTIEKPLPRYCLAGATVAKITSGSFAAPFSKRSYNGYLRYLNMLNGATYNILPSVAVGGQTLQQTILSLPSHLEFYKPNVCWMHPLENDMATITIEKAIEGIKSLAEICLQHNCMPIIAAPVPTSAGINATLWTNVCAAVIDIGNVVPGSVGVEPGKVYLDTSSIPNPLSGWVGDTIHPLGTRGYDIAQGIRDATARLFAPDNKIISLLHGPNCALRGVGGTQVFLQAGSIVAAGCNIIGVNGVGAQSASKGSGDVQVLNATLPNDNTRRPALTFQQAIPVTPPSAFSFDTWIKGVVKLKVTKSVSFSDFQLMIQNTNSPYEQYSNYIGAGELALTDISGETLTIETPAARIDSGVTSISIIFSVFNKATTVDPSFDFSCELLNMGFVVCNKGDMFI